MLGLKLRANEQAELLSLGYDEMGEFAYNHVGIKRDCLAWAWGFGDVEMKPIEGVQDGNGGPGVRMPEDPKLPLFQRMSADAGIVGG